MWRTLENNKILNETTHRFSHEEIREYWKEQARRFGQSSATSWSDQEVIEMEIRAISQYLTEGERVLDIGYANGYSTVQYVAHRKSYFKGLDLFLMIEQAISRRSPHGSLAGTLEFGVGDMTALSETDQAYDKGNYDSRIDKPWHSRTPAVGAPPMRTRAAEWWQVAAFGGNCARVATTE